MILVSSGYVGQIWHVPLVSVFGYPKPLIPSGEKLHDVKHSSERGKRGGGEGCISRNMVRNICFLVIRHIMQQQCVAVDSTLSEMGNENKIELNQKGWQQEIPAPSPPRKKYMRMWFPFFEN